MTTYRVIRKSDGLTVYAYQADAPVEWQGMGFADFDHIAQGRATEILAS